MFLGHFALAFAAKGIEPRTSLGTSIAAAQLADLIWPAFLIAGWERVAIAPGDTAFTPLRLESYPYSHSLVGMGAFGFAFAVIHWWRRRRRAAAALLFGLVLSHWLLDVVTHRPDVPILLRGGPRLGLGLWNSVAGTLIVEGLLFAAGVAVYLRVTRARDAVGRQALFTLVVFLVLAYLGAAFGPPPPSVGALAATAALLVLLVPWAAWADRHREDAPTR